MPLIGSVAESHSAESLLRPYLSAILSLTSSANSVDPLFTMFYIQHPFKNTRYCSPPDFPSVLVTPSGMNFLPETGDAAALDAEAVFWKAIHILQALRRRSNLATPDENNSVDEHINTFWPATADGDQDTDEDW